jgi:O-antigen/teichoic acid export membrane protein
LPSRTHSKHLRYLIGERLAGGSGISRCRLPLRHPEHEKKPTSSAALSQPLIRVWAGEPLVPRASVAWLLAVQFALIAWANLSGYFLLAAGRYAAVARAGVIGGLVSLALNAAAVPRFGAEWVPITNIACLVIFVVGPLELLARRVIRDGLASAGIAS